MSLTPGGTERLVVELVRRSQPRMPTAVCCLDELGAWGQQLRTEGVAVTALGRQPGFHPTLALRIADAAAAHRATVIHAHQYTPFVYSALARLKRPGLRIVFTEHGRLSDAPPSAKRAVANQALSRLPHAVYAVSAELREHILAEGFPAATVGVIYNGIDIGPLPDPSLRAQVRAELRLADDVFVVGTIARLDPVKDLGTLIAAAADLNRRRPTVLLVIGDGPVRGELERTSDTSDGGASARFLGHRDDARRLLAACDAFANCSISEGVSLTILEAMAAGLPVAATRVGGTPEVLDETCGILVQARAPAAMTTALASLAADEAGRAQLGKNGRLRVETRFTLDRMVGDYNAVYERLSRR